MPLARYVDTWRDMEVDAIQWTGDLNALTGSLPDLEWRFGSQPYVGGAPVPGLFWVVLRGVPGGSTYTAIVPPDKFSARYRLSTEVDVP